MRTLRGRRVRGAGALPIVILSWIGAVSTAGCQPGGLSEDEQRAFRRELRKNYAEQEPEPEEAEPEDPGGDAAAGPGVDASDTDAEEPEPEPETSSPIDDCVIQVFQSSCSGLGCHAGGDFNSRPDLDQDNLFEYLTTTGPMACDEVTANYVDLNDPEQSFMLLKVLGAQPAACGTEMPPPGAMTLTQTQRQCMEDWFDSL